MTPKTEKEELEGDLSLPDETAVASANLNTSSSLSNMAPPPLVKVELENVTYAPMVASTTPMKSNKNSTSKKRKIVLDNVSTSISPHELTAWMGPSGSGKTSLVSVVAGLVEQDDLLQSSSIRVNGMEGRLPKQLVGVVWQDDLLLSNLTVEEIITFSARLKSSLTDKSEISKLVEDTMRQLGLLGVRNSLIGNGHNTKNRGVSGGERKRVSVASELVSRPSLLLLDEPTSGLDATSAQSLMYTLKQLALAGHSVAVVCHQPRTSIFEMLDKLLLLSKGRVVYNGKACHARAHLEACPTVAPLPPETGIADWFLDVITADEQEPNNTSVASSGSSTPSVLAQHWRDHDNREDDPACTSTARDLSERQLSTLQELHETVPKFEVSFWTQLVLLSKRALKQQRGEKLTRVGVLLTATYTFFTGLFWFRLQDDTSRVFERNSVMFFMLIAQANGIVTSSMTIFQQERALLSRERAKKLYGVLPYFLAKTASDMTNNVFLPTCYCAITYWLVALRPTAAAFFGFLLTMYLTLSTAQSMGLMFSIAIPNMQIALMLAPPITLFFIILAGFYIPLDNLHKGIQWASYLSFARYGYSAMLVNEYSGRDVPCAEDSDISVSIGTVDECPLPGEDIIASMGITGISTEFWFNVLIVAALQILFRVTAYILLRRSK